MALAHDLPWNLCPSKVEISGRCAALTQTNAAMKRSTHSQAHIVSALKQPAAGPPAAEAGGKMGPGKAAQRRTAWIAPSLYVPIQAGAGMLWRINRRARAESGPYLQGIMFLAGAWRFTQMPRSGRGG